MIRNLTDKNFKWIDVLEPAPEELANLAKQYGIHEAFVADVLQPEHLPKYEPVGNTSFLYSAIIQEQKIPKWIPSKALPIR